MDNPKVVILLCAHTDFKFASMFDIFKLLLEEERIINIYGINGCLLPLARNQVLYNFYKVVESQPDLEQPTHFLFIDSDTCGITPQLVSDLLAADKPIISPLLISRNPPFPPAVNYLKDGLVSSHEELLKIMSYPKEKRPCIKVKSTGMACTLIRKEIFDTMPRPWFHCDRKPRPEFKEEIKKKFEFLTTTSALETLTNSGLFTEGVSLGLNAHKGTEPIGEDINFCYDAARYKFDTWVHTGCYINHIGEVQYNFGDTLLFLKQPDLLSRLEQVTYVWSKKKE